MREVNFSIPLSNKASVGITTALYDRRALDCTSTLPLINSLNHLAYLTTSTARIRDILTIDGGVERLVVILKEGRSKELMSMWKWNLAFQCVVNIGVRGSEVVRRRVVEADMVPVIATILDNYIQVTDRQAAQEGRAISARRTVALPKIVVPQNSPTGNADTLPRPTGQTRGTPQHRQQMQVRFGAQRDPLTELDEFNPVRPDHRLPSNLGGPSQPASPTTPNPPTNGRRAYNGPNQVAIDYTQPTRRTGHNRHQRSLSGESDGEELGSVGIDGVQAPEPIVDIQNGADLESDEMLESVEAPMGITTDAQDETDPFNIMHRSTINGSIINPGPDTAGFPNNQPTANPAFAIPGSLQMPGRYMEGATPTANPSPAPRDEDVLMSLQLLAYVSKYCNLRSYFQKSHLVPQLSVDCDDSKTKEVEEYLLPDDFNIFPLVEKYTVRNRPADMQYWAGVVMRNLCRKDDSKGGIRQCAYYECGKWEKYQRQFAKCRRCRRTKYCSKECQKSAWVYHRHWCVQATSNP